MMNDYLFLRLICTAGIVAGYTLLIGAYKCAAKLAGKLVKAH